MEKRSLESKSSTLVYFPHFPNIPANVLKVLGGRNFIVPCDLEIKIFGRWREWNLGKRRACVKKFLKPFLLLPTHYKTLSRGIPVKPGGKLRTLRKNLGENESWGEGNEETVGKPKDFWHWTDNFDFWLCFLVAGKDLESIFLVTAACEEKWSFSSCIPSLFPCPLQQVAAFYGNARKICSNFPWTPPPPFLPDDVWKKHFSWHTFPLLAPSR